MLNARGCSSVGTASRMMRVIGACSVKRTNWPTANTPTKGASDLQRRKAACRRTNASAHDARHTAAAPVSEPPNTSRISPPATVPRTPDTTVTPPKRISAWPGRMKNMNVVAVGPQYANMPRRAVCAVLPNIPHVYDLRLQGHIGRSAGTHRVIGCQC